MDMNNTSIHVMFNISSCDGVFLSLNGHCVYWQDVAINAFIFLLGFCIIATNFWIVWILFSRIKDEDTSLFIIQNLAVADTFTGFIVIYDSIYNVIQFSVYVECVLRIGLFISCSLASVFIITVLTLERLIKISNSYTYRKYISIKRTRIGLVFVWMTSLVVGLLPFFGWSSMNVLYLCSFFRTMSKSYIIFVLTIHVTPFLCTLCAYLWMVTVVRRHVTAIRHTRGTGRGRGNRRGSTLRAVMTTLIVVGVYFLCWAPIGLFTILVLLFELDRHLTGNWSADVVFTYLLILAVTNCLCNPLIYAFKLDIVRRQFRSSFLFRCFASCHRVSWRFQ